MHIGPPSNTAKSPERLPPLMVLLAGCAALGLFSSLLLPHILSLLPSAPLHLALAVGIMPLILGAMIYFTPVLTRSGPPAPGILALPLLALLAGLAAFLSLTFSFRHYPLAAALALAAVGALSLWMRRRARATLGRPHPGLWWYRLALIALALGLAAAILGALWPEHWPALRRLHLHLNLLGFVGLTALGTLRVLLPTVGGYADPQAGPWLLREWKWLAAGALLIASGAAWLPALSWLGVLPWSVPLSRLGRDLLAHRTSLLQWHGAGVSLLAALVGLTLSLLAGLAHGLGALSATYATRSFIVMFLLPLVTGALSHLLPLWLGKNRPPEWQKGLRQRLGRHAGWRALAFLVAGLLLLAGQPWATLLAVAALGQFVFQTRSRRREKS